MEPLVVVHGGTGSPPAWADGCAAAARRGAAVLGRGGSALDAVVAAVRAMEEDGRFNAGLGAFPRLDGTTIETDAGVMDSEGRLGAVAALRGFLHPIDAARHVADTPHVLLAGEGAARFAARRGLERGLDRPHPRAKERHAKAIRAFLDGQGRPAWRDADLEALWNFPGPLPEELRPRDTVGAVARDAQGRFATANSTGGAVPMLLGRVGDSPIAGAGFWAGPAGAIAATGMGEDILRRMASYEVHARLARGQPAEEALDEVIALFPDDVSFGACVVGAETHAVRANREMAGAVARP